MLTNAVSTLIIKENSYALRKIVAVDICFEKLIENTGK